jgi:hypothetical protein
VKQLVHITVGIEDESAIAVNNHAFFRIQIQDRADERVIVNQTIFYLKVGSLTELLNFNEKPSLLQNQTKDNE